MHPRALVWVLVAAGCTPALPPSPPPRVAHATGSQHRQVVQAGGSRPTTAALPVQGTCGDPAHWTACMARPTVTVESIDPAAFNAGLYAAPGKPDERP
jgi:hypothetical protein